MASENIAIRAAELADARAIADIYNHYVAKTVITFEEEPIGAEEMAGRIGSIRSASLPFLVAEESGRVVVGYAYAAPWRARSAYRYSAEITAYLSPEQARRGIGTMLYGELLPMLQERGVHAVMGGIALPNDASVALHEKFGLRRVAEFREVGFKFDQWIDVGYWQRIF